MMLAAAFLVIALALIGLWKVPQLQIQNYQRRYPALSPADLLKAENDFRATLAQILGGAALLAGLYFTARTLVLQQEGQLTDRISKAVEQLGSERPDISLGGIYQLARIARDSDRDHWAMMQVLMSYTERHAALPAVSIVALQKQCDPNQYYDRSETPDYNVQAVVNVIRTRDAEKESSDQRVSIVHTNLRHIDMSQANLRGAQLIGNDMGGAVLINAALDGNARLSFSLLNNANLTKANLSDAHLEHTCLVRAQLTGTDFSRAHLEQADLRNVVDAEGADFSAAVLDGADLRGAELQKARGLVVGQVAEAKLDCNTQLPPYLAKQQSKAKCDE